MRRCLITGAGGFQGSHLAEDLHRRGWEVYGTIRPGSAGVVQPKGTYSLLPCDMLVKEQVAATLQIVRPEIVFHLAAQSLPVLSWQDPAYTFQVNVLGTLHVIEGIRTAGLDPVIIVAGSSAEYGMVQRAELPIQEDRPLLPASPYGVSKVAADLLARLYGKTYGLKVIVVRPFLVVGPRKAGDVCSDIARGIVAAEASTERVLKVGNLEAVRDFVDVDDAVRAAILLAEEGTAGEVYNICTGAGHSIQEVLDMFLSLVAKTITVEQDPTRMRPLDEPVIIGDNSKLRDLGWEPAVPLEQSLKRILDRWRQEESDTPELRR